MNRPAGMSCTVHCNPEYEFAVEVPRVYTCLINGKWIPKPPETVPDCSGEELMYKSLYNYSVILKEMKGILVF